MSSSYETLFDLTAAMDAVAESSQAVFRDHGLADLAAAIVGPTEVPDPASLLPFRIVLPAVYDQKRFGGDMVRSFAAASLGGIDEAEQYNEPYAPDDESFEEVQVHRRPDGPYLLSFDPEEFRAELRGLTAPAIRKQLDAEERTSLTAFEYLVLQRIMTQYYGDHRFDYYGSDVDDTRWMWLPDSKLGDKTFMGYWNPGKGRVELSLCRTGSKNPRKGAYATIVVPNGT